MICPFCAKPTAEELDVIAVEEVVDGRSTLAVARAMASFVSSKILTGAPMRIFASTTAGFLLALGACALNQREIVRIPLYEDSWDCVLSSFDALGYERRSPDVENGRIRMYQGLEYVEIEEGTHQGSPVLILRGSTGFMQSTAATAADGQTVSGMPRHQVIDVARACGPGLIGTP